MKDGGPAFPIRERTEHIDGAIVCEEWSGMSLRDWFAGMSLLGRRANPHFVQSSLTAEECYGDADAMLKEREKDNAL